MSSPTEDGCIPRVLGHEEILAELLQAIATERSHHGLLLTGPAGIGKSLAARLLGMAFLCPNRTPAGPCGGCRSCQRVASGSHPDWHELVPSGQGAQGTISIERVRELEGTLWLAPGEGVGRVALVDQAQLLGTVGQNAILKTLEEPPPRTLFMLVAPRPSDLLPTVLSRCQVVRFTPLPDRVLEELLVDRAEPELVEQALELAGGSMGRALAFLAGAGPEMLGLAGEVWEQGPALDDPVGTVANILALAGADEGEGLTPAARRRRCALVFLRTMQQVGGRSLRTSLLEQGPDTSYDLGFAELAENWLSECLNAENEILANLDPTLVLEVLLIRLRRKSGLRQ